MVEKWENPKKTSPFKGTLQNLFMYVAPWMKLTKATPSCCLVSGPLTTSNYNNCNLSPLLALRMCNYVVCHHTRAVLYSKGLSLHYYLVSHYQNLSWGVTFGLEIIGASWVCSRQASPWQYSVAMQDY